MEILINQNIETMKNRIIYILLGLILCSCEKEEYIVRDLSTSGEEISRIELRADHKTLLPNGEAKMEFYTFVYGTKKVISYHRDEDKDNEYVTDTTEMEYLIPNDQLPAGLVKVYDPSGKELKDNVYSTTTEKAGSVLEFQAKANTVVSNTHRVTVRELPDESYEELVIPVIFHMLIPPKADGPEYNVSVEYLETRINEMNDIFNRRITSDPNGGNVKITFRLAEYDNSGVRMQEKGKHIIKLSAANMSWIEKEEDDYYEHEAYSNFIIKYWRSCLWDPSRYLNIWLINLEDSYSNFTLPADMHPNYAPESIPGLKIKRVVDQFGYNEVEDAFEVGVMISFNIFLNPQLQGSNEFSLAGVLGGYYGLMETNCRYYNNLNEDGDFDYCPDTYTYYYAYNPSVFKSNQMQGQPEDRPLEWFTSFGVMDRYSRKNSVSVDQALRMRKVLKQCPSRWNYKSDWAFTGQGK